MIATLPCRYHGKIAFGEALRSNAEVSGAFGVSSYPTLLVVCGGNRDVVVKYEGESMCRLPVNASIDSALWSEQLIQRCLWCAIATGTWLVKYEGEQKMHWLVVAAGKTGT